MTTPSFVFSSTLLLATLLPLALAPSAQGASEDTKERSARKACLSGNYQKGVELLSDLFVKTEDPIFIYNQGRCFEQNGRCEEAVNRFREYLRKDKKMSPDEKADAEKHIADCQTLLGQKSAPEAGRENGSKAPVQEVPQVTQKPESARESTTAQQPKAEAVPLAPVPATPPTSPPPAAGAVTAAPEQSLTSSAAPATPIPGRNLRIAGIICGAVGVGAIGTGVYFYTRARSYSDKVSGQTTPDPSDDSAGKTAQTMQWVFYSVGGAALATGVVLYALGWPTSDANRPVSAIAPLLGPGLAGISAQGSF
jgi:hypothetical protein